MAEGAVTVAAGAWIASDIRGVRGGRMGLEPPSSSLEGPFRPELPIFLLMELHELGPVEEQRPSDHGRMVKQF